MIPWGIVGGRLQRLNWGVYWLVAIIAGVGVAMLYSVAQGNWDPWADKHAVRFGLFSVMAIALAVFGLRFWFAIAYPLYVISLLMLLAVEFFGTTVMGATRWLDLGVTRVQPSEFMKVALILALAKYFHQLPPSGAGGFWLAVLAPTLIILAPVALVMHQPDLGTALLLMGSGLAVMFLAGLRWRYIIGAIVLAIPTVIFAFYFILHDYQRKRIITFLDPNADPLGASYHVLQSKIAIGSGGFFGKGYMQGSQGVLDFLPEKHTDFIFTMVAEEFGMIGALALLALFAALLVRFSLISNQARPLFSKLAGGGAAASMLLYVLINTGMVMGLLPVVGVPLPLVSFGGTVMIVTMAILGLILAIDLDKARSLNSRPSLF